MSGQVLYTGFGSVIQWLEAVSMKMVGYAPHSSDVEMVPYHFERRVLHANDLAIEIILRSMCHSDLHTETGD